MVYHCCHYHLNLVNYHPIVVVVQLLNQQQLIGSSLWWTLQLVVVVVSVIDPWPGSKVLADGIIRLFVVVVPSLVLLVLPMQVVLLLLLTRLVSTQTGSV